MEPSRRQTRTRWPTKNTQLSSRSNQLQSGAVRSDNSSPVTPATQDTVTLLGPVPGSPWERYRKGMTVTIGTDVTIATQRSDPRSVVLIRIVTKPPESALYMLQNVRHPVFVECLEFYNTYPDSFLVIPYMGVSLLDIIGGPEACEESEVAQLIHEVGSLNSDCTILQLTSAAIRGCCISPNPFSNAWKLIS